MKLQNERAIIDVGFLESQIESKSYLNLRYIGTNTSIMIEMPSIGSDSSKTIEKLFAEAFET